MPKRSEKRDTAKAEYIARKARGEEVSLRELAKEQGVGYQTLRNWKARTSGTRRCPKESGAASRGTGIAPGNRTLRGAIRAHRSGTRMRRRTERTAPSFLIC